MNTLCSYQFITKNLHTQPNHNNHDYLEEFRKQVKGKRRRRPAIPGGAGSKARRSRPVAPTSPIVADQANFGINKGCYS
jgi:hypothetical protein